MRHRRGFTMLELLVVIGILLLLIGMLFVGLRYLGAGGQVRSTQVTLDNLQSMLAEYEVTGNSFRRLNQIYAADNENPLTAPMNVRQTSVEDPRYGARDGDLVHISFEVMERLFAVPAVRQMMEQVPSEQLMPDPQDPDHPPILLDAWGNPIIFVPSGGLRVHHQPSNEGSVISSPDGRPFFASAGESGWFQGSRDDSVEAFWRKVDDNLYSFEN